MPTIIAPLIRDEQTFLPDLWSIYLFLREVSQSLELSNKSHYSSNLNPFPNPLYISLVFAFHLNSPEDPIG